MRLEALIPNAFVLILSLMATYLVEQFFPPQSQENLHLNAIYAIQAVEPTLQCSDASDNTAPRFKPSLLPEATPLFLDVVRDLNQLAKRQGLKYRCAPEAISQSDSRLQTDEQAITRITARGIQRLDSILAIYHHDPDLPRSSLRNLQNLRAALVRIAYAKGDLNSLRLLTAAADIIAVMMALAYMIFTFQAMRRALPDGQNLFYLILLGLTLLVVFSTVPFSLRDSFVTPYSLLPLMIISWIYTRWVATKARKTPQDHGGLLAFSRLLSWGATSYGVILFAVAAPYYQAELSVGAYPFRITRLNIANFFFACALTVFTYHLLRRPKFTSKRTLAGIATLLVGPVAFFVAILNYAGAFGPPGHPGNILYRLLPEHLAIGPPLIEIVLARLMISLPLVVVIGRRLLLRTHDKEAIRSFLRSQNAPSNQVTLELLPDLPVNISADGVLFPNPHLSLSPTPQSSRVTTPDAPRTQKKRSNARKQQPLEFAHVFSTLAKLARPLNVLMASALAAISYLSTQTALTPSGLAILLLTTAFAVAGSFILNDVADRSIDLINKPHRPIPSGLVTPRHGLIAGIALLCAAPALALLHSKALFLFWLVASLLSVAYSVFLKPRLGFAANLLSSSLTASISLLGPLVNGRVETMHLVAITVFFAALAREVAKDVEDLPGDMHFRRHTLALLLGRSTALKIALIACSAQIASSYLPYISGGAGGAYVIGITLANGILLLSLSRNSDANLPTVIQKAVKTSMVFYLVVYASFGL